MRGRNTALAFAGVLLIGGLGGCATKDYVDGQVGALSGRVADHDNQITAIDRRSREALARAEAAGRLAEGKFVYSMVLSDDGVRFPAGGTKLTSEAQLRLQAFAERLKSENRNVYVEVQGHTDSSGSPQANYRIGEARAEAVRRYLNQQGVALNRIGVISYGADDPVASNSTAAGRAANRRVVLIVLS